jgi:four helix bundle protein
MEENTLKAKSYLFALEAISIYKELCEKREFILSKQFVRSATSVGANIREANNAQSNADFIHKLSISIKECNETQYWLELMRDSNYLDIKTFHSSYEKSKEIYRMLASSILTCKKKGKG